MKKTHFYSLSAAALASALLAGSAASAQAAPLTVSDNGDVSITAGSGTICDGENSCNICPGGSKFSEPTPNFGCGNNGTICDGDDSCNICPGGKKFVEPSPTNFGCGDNGTICDGDDSCNWCPKK